jgi:thiamine biosynthesis lipoprotein
VISREHELTFESMGSDVRLLIGPSTRAGVTPAADAAEREQRFVEDYARRLTRFDPASELSVLNADPRAEVPASRLLRAAVASGVWAAERSGGLVDPTLVRAIERAGYRGSRIGATPAPLSTALAAAPPRRPAAPDPAARWRSVTVDDEAGIVRRPPGLALDTGGTGKGLAADAVAHRLAAYRRFVVDCGGDIAVRGEWDIEVEHPVTGERAHTLRVSSGGVATSGVNVRVWRRLDGTFAHHLLDPSTGEPAWTGLIAATALGDSALEAETLSKTALLSGPNGAREVLATRGGVIVHDDGDVELVGTTRPRPRIRISVAELGVAA